MDEERIREIAREEARRSFTRQLVLDVGAGPNVDRRATHAVDLQAPKWLSEISPPPGVDYYPDPVNLGGRRYFLWGREIRPYEKLPYESNMFDLVVSHSALGVDFKERHAYEEVFRALKSGGKIELEIPNEFKEDVSPALISLQQVGFKSVTTCQNGTTRILAVKN